jgi:hypothetical protein
MHADPSTLSNLAAGRQLAQVGRKRLQGPELTEGIVVAASEELLVVNKLSDAITLDGFEVLRIRDISSVATEFRKKEFYAAALRLKGIEAQPLPPGGIGTMAEAIVSFSASCPLLVFARERIDRRPVWIGRVTEVMRRGVRVQLIDPTARLIERQVYYGYDSITRLELGGEYERTLALVAGLS